MTQEQIDNKNDNSGWGDQDVSSGKGASDENFPVGSLFIRKSLRPHIHAYYNYARVIDDIADCPDLTIDEKITRLNLMGDVLLGKRKPIERTDSLSAARLRQSFLQTHVPFETATDLLKAFCADSRGETYVTFDDLLRYCRYSANPVGHFLLTLHHEDNPNVKEASDSLCTSLQILNHLQDCQNDLDKLKRCYLPKEYLNQFHITQDALREHKTSSALRSVFNALLDHVDQLNENADQLPLHVRDRRFRMECATIVKLAHKLAYRLRHEDPLAGRVKLHVIDIVSALWTGVKMYSPLSDH